MEEQKEHYLTNKTFLAEWQKCIETGFISETLGQMFILLCQKMTNHRNFVRYPPSIKEELVSAGSVACCNSWKNFDPSFSEYPNPFAYFSSVIWNAFVAVAKKEYDQSNIRNAVKMMHGMEPDHGYQDVLDSQRKKADNKASAKRKEKT